jgi:predicted RNA-binding Zn-ribbon protein involved in translation (DUF1610 family)
MPLTCGCAPKWLTSASQPVTAEAAVEQPCPCCGAVSGKRCAGGTAGWLDAARTRAWVDVCPGRLEIQRSLL